MLWENNKLSKRTDLVFSFILSAYAEFAREEDFKRGRNIVPKRLNKRMVIFVLLAETNRKRVLQSLSSVLFPHHQEGNTDPFYLPCLL